jgi:hypothetical protein
MRRFTRVALLTGVLAIACGVSEAKAGPRFFFQVGTPVPPPPVVVVRPVPPPAPAYGMVWRPGYYAWTGYRYNWVPGVWVRPPYAGARWVAPGWVRQPRGYAWSGGYWRR